MAVKAIQMMEKTADGYNMLVSTGGRAVIRVTSIAGTTVTCSFNEWVQSYTFSSNETHDFYGVGYGVYTMTATDGANTHTITKEIKESKLYEIVAVPYSSILDECTWNQISEASLKGAAQNIWSLGDIKMITVNGSIADGTFNGSYGVFIASFSHNPTVEGNGILFHSFKNNLIEKKDIALRGSFYMNTTKITNGGWRDCYMRKNIIPQFENAISTDLRSVVKTSTIYSHNYIGGSQNDNASYVTTTRDKFYMLAEFEILGHRSYANSYEKNHQVQVEYYKLGNSRIKTGVDNIVQASGFWWERSVACNEPVSTNFCAVSRQGEASVGLANGSCFFAVAFRV